MTVNELSDFICENYYRQVGFNKENTYSLKHPKEKIYYHLQPNQ